MSPDAGVLSEKDIQDAIGVCFNKSDKQLDLDIRAPVIVDAMRKLFELPVPPFQLMRTLLLTSRSFPDVLKFLLTEAIPALVRCKSWSTAPRVWDGVLHCIKKYHQGHSKDGVESTLRAVLGLPLKQFNIVLQVGEVPVKNTLTNLVKALSPAEKTEVLTGRWVGLAEDNQLSDSEEKMKILLPGS